MNGVVCFFICVENDVGKARVEISWLTTRNGKRLAHIGTGAAGRVRARGMSARVGGNSRQELFWGKNYFCCRWMLINLAR
jgi:hypothetical protein